MSENVVYVRTAERKSYRTCRQQWYWSFIDRIETVATRPALRFGDLSHQSLAVWYRPGRKRGRKPWLTFERLYMKQLEDGLDQLQIRLEEDEDWVNALELGIDMMRHYVDHWGNDDHLNIISPEFPFKCWLTDKHGRQLRAMNAEGLLVPVQYLGKFDAIAEDMTTAQIGLLEHKTAAAINTAYLSLDDQAGSYWAMAPLVLPNYRWRGKPIIPKGKDIDFILYNFLRKAKRDTRPVGPGGERLNKPKKDVLLRKVAETGQYVPRSTNVETLIGILKKRGIDATQLGEISKVQPPKFFHRQKVYRDDADRHNLMQRIRMEVWEMGQVRAGKLPIYKNPSGSYPDQHCLACQFRDMCELHETGSDWEELRDFTMKPWDPYADQVYDDWSYE